QPAGDAVAQILAVGVEADPDRPLQGFETLDCRHQFHAVVGGQLLATGNLLLDGSVAQYCAPAAWARIAAARAVGKDFDVWLLQRVTSFETPANAGSSG